MVHQPIQLFLIPVAQTLLWTALATISWGESQTRASLDETTSNSRASICRSRESSYFLTKANSNFRAFICCSWNLTSSCLCFQEVVLLILLLHEAVSLWSKSCCLSSLSFSPMRSLQDFSALSPSAAYSWVSNSWKRREGWEVNKEKAYHGQEFPKHISFFANDLYPSSVKTWPSSQAPPPPSRDS